MKAHIHLSLIPLLAGLLISCVSSKAWVIETNENGGLIGYRGERPVHEGDRQLRALIPCDDYRVLYDRAGVTPKDSVNPVKDSSKGGEWREVRYVCRSERAPSQFQNSPTEKK